MESRITLTRGGDARVTFKLSDASGALIDLTGYGARFRARRMQAAATAPYLIEKNTAALLLGRFDRGRGRVNLHLTAADTRALPAGNLTEFEVELIAPNGDQTVVVNGTINAKSGLSNVDS